MGTKQKRMGKKGKPNVLIWHSKLNIIHIKVIPDRDKRHKRVDSILE